MRVETPAYISATGPDGAGKDTAWKNAKPWIPEDLTIVKIGKPSSIIRNGYETYVHTSMSRALDQMHGWADQRRSRTLTLISNTLYVMFQWAIQEPLLTREVKPDLVFSLRDGYVDPAAYAPYYSQNSLGRLKIPERIDVLHALHRSPFRQHTIFLDVDPAVAVRRITQRMESEAQNSNGLLRPKWVHQHENEYDLTSIREEFLRVLGYLEENKKTRVTQINTTGTSKAEVGVKLAQEILSNVR